MIRDEIATNKKSKFLGPWASSFTNPSLQLDLAQTMVPPELLNNYAVLLIETGKIAEAKRVLEEALANCESQQKAGGSEDLRLRALKITNRFNLGCCLESENNIGDATDMFKAITQEEPSYQDAYIRLANLAKRRGDFGRAI